MLLKKNLTLVKDSEEDSIQKHYYNGVSHQGREIGLNPKYNKKKWGLLEKEQS